MRIGRRFVAAGALCLAALLSAAPAVRADVLDQVPGDALLVLKVNSLEGLNKKIATFAKGAGFDQLEPKLADPLSSMIDEAKIGKGLDRNGDFAMAFLDPAKFGGEGAGGEPKSLLVLVPTTDFKAFLTNFKSAAAEGDVYKVQPQDGPDAAYVANWGTYAAVTPTKAVLANKPTGLKLTGFSAKESKAKDVLFYTNVKVLKGMALPKLKEAKVEALGGDGKEGQIAGALGDNKKFLPLAKAAAGQMFNVAEEFLNDAHSATVGLTINDAGVTMTLAADFDPTSYLGKMALQTKGSEASMLAGLPDKKYFAFGGSAGDPAVTSKLIGDILDPVIKELAAVPETKKFATALEASKKALGSTTGTSMGYVAPTPGVELGKESVIQQVAIIRGDAAAIRDSQRVTLEAMNDLLGLMPKQEGQSIKFSYNPGAKKVGGVSFDEFKTDIQFNGDDPTQQQVKQMMAFVYGPNGQSGVLTQVGDKAVLTVQGGTDDLIGDAYAAAKADADTLGAGAGVRAVAAQLPKTRNVAFYVDLGTIVNTSLRYAKAMGAPINVSAPADLPPIGMTAGADGTAVRADLHIPAKLVQGMAATYAKAQAQMRDPNGPQ
ncbi:MAG TPA: hypothetical protein VF796_01765 [Humisphaera sp.]